MDVVDGVASQTFDKAIAATTAATTTPPSPRASRERISSASPSSERPDLSSSYDELMQTVIWVPPATSSRENAAAANDDAGASAMDSDRAGNCVSGASHAVDVHDEDVEATESARDGRAGARKSRLEFDGPSVSTPARVDGNRVAESYSLEEEPVSLVALERNVFDLAEKFRKGVVGEIEAMKDSLCRRHEAEIRALKEENGRKLASLNHQLSRQRDLNDTFVQTLARKEETIENLLQCLAKEKDKDRLANLFVSWREKTRDSDKFETPLSKMARKYHEFLLRRRAWTAWSNVARVASRAKFEARVREETGTKLETMEKECDARMLTLQAAVRSARAEVEALRGERESHEERVKAALMRGVCALNVETMSVLSGGGGSVNSVRSSGSVDGSLNASSIHALHNGSSSARGGKVRGDDPVTGDRVDNRPSKDAIAERESVFSSTPDVSPSVSSQILSSKAPPVLFDSDLLGVSNLPHSINQQSLQQRQQQQQPSLQHLHTRSTNRSVYQSSNSRRSCGVNPIGNVAKERGAQIKSLPHSTIVIERHVDRT